MSIQDDKKPVARGGSAFLTRHGLVSILVPVTEEVRGLCAAAARVAGHRAASRWAAGVLEAAAREALALPPAPPPEDGSTAALTEAAAALRQQADALDCLARKILPRS